MFLNTVPLVSTGSTITVALIDGPTNQKTIRSSADGKTVLTIGHQETSENGKAIKTQRSNVRIELSKEIEDTGVSAKGYVQYNMSFPKDVFSAAEVRAAANKLVNFLFNEDATLESADDGALINVTRLYGGEP